MDWNREDARRQVDDAWAEGIRFGVVSAPAMRPGRGRARSAAKGRRYAAEESFRAEELAARLHVGLASGAFTPSSAREAVFAACLDESIRIVETRAGAVDAFAEFLDHGFWLWTVDHDAPVPGAVAFHARFGLRSHIRRT
ncbi:hypothetical protein [Paludisphaera soli]|uniref:hypothetical protein n=1 Tax=Paludisphaera soli TaxID=2712865 RepID=UPI0013E9F88C|nr:hypothetical protein [Paludisphaera soli]